MARIHTLEWTPAILPNESLLDGMHANWFGLVTSLFGGERKQVLEDIPITSRELGGIVGNVPGRVPAYGLAEEFVSIYRLHSLLPDEVRMVDVDGKATSAVPTGMTRHAASPRLFAEHGFEALARTFGEQSACQLVNNNYPDTLRTVSVPGHPVIDLGALDLYRDRERGVPNYNQLRRELGLNPIETFDDLTDDRDVRGDPARGLRRRRRRATTTSTTWTCWSARSAEGHRPTGFGFGETLFQIFIMNASLRLLADRFFTIDYRAEIYTPEGLAWIDNTRFKDVLLRHLPGLADTGLANIDNAFEPWDFGTLAPERTRCAPWDKNARGPLGRGRARPELTQSGTSTLAARGSPSTAGRTRRPPVQPVRPEPPLQDAAGAHERRVRHLLGQHRGVRGRVDRVGGVPDDQGRGGDRPASLGRTVRPARRTARARRRRPSRRAGPSCPGRSRPRTAPARAGSAGSPAAAR